MKDPHDWHPGIDFMAIRDARVMDAMSKEGLENSGFEELPIPLKEVRKSFISAVVPTIIMEKLHKKNTDLFNNKTNKPKETCRVGEDEDDPKLWKLMRDENSYIHEHLETLRMLTVMTKPDSILEIGTGRGDSTLAFADACASNGSGHVITLDIITPHKALDVILDGDVSSYVTFLRMSSQDYLKKLDGVASINMVFIDGLHTKKQVEMELILLAPYLTDEGMIILHDTNNPAHPGVREAVEEFLANGNIWENFTQFEYLHCNGLMILQYDRPSG